MSRRWWVQELRVGWTRTPSKASRWFTYGAWGFVAVVGAVRREWSIAVPAVVLLLHYGSFCAVAAERDRLVDQEKFLRRQARAGWAMSDRILASRRERNGGAS